MKVGHPTLQNNKAGSLLRLKSLFGKLNKDPKNTWIVQQHHQRSISRRNYRKGNKAIKFYILHKPDIRVNAKSTKMQIVSDASVKSNCSSPSLNECLETGPALQNLLRSVVLRNQLFSVLLCGGIKQTFPSAY